MSGSMVEMHKRRLGKMHKRRLGERGGVLFHIRFFGKNTKSEQREEKPARDSEGQIHLKAAAAKQTSFAYQGQSSHGEMQEEQTFNPYADAAFGEQAERISPYVAAAPSGLQEERQAAQRRRGGIGQLVNFRGTYCFDDDDDEQTAHPYDVPVRTLDRSGVSPYGANAAGDEERTVNPYDTDFDDGQTVYPYAAQCAADDESTINPYDLEGDSGEQTVNPFGERVPRGRKTQGCSSLENMQPFEEPEGLYQGCATQSGVMDDEETVNPYAMEWLPKLTVEFEVKCGQKVWKKQILFVGSMWIGITEQCELQIDAKEGEAPCAELIYNGGNLYIRNVSTHGERIMLNDSELGAELVMLLQGSRITIGAAQISRVEMV